MGARRSTANGFVVRAFVARISARRSSGERFAAPMIPRPPAFETAATSGAIDTPPMPARRIGYSIPRRSQSGVRSRERPPPFDDAGDAMRGTFDAVGGRVKAGRMTTAPLPVLVGAGQIVDRPDDPRNGLE